MTINTEDLLPPHEGSKGEDKKKDLKKLVSNIYGKYFAYAYELNKSIIPLAAFHFRLA